MDFKFEFEGLEQLITSLERVGDNVEEAKEEALINGAKIVQKEASKNARQLNKSGKATGNLAERVEISDVKNDEIDVYVDQQGPAYYGKMLEEGTSKMPPYPWMFPAFLATQRPVQQEMAHTFARRLVMFR